MNWKNERGYSITGTYNDSKFSRVCIFVFKTKTGILWVDTGYLDPWNSSHTSHQFDGDVTEYDERVAFKSDDFDWVIAPIKDDGLKREFEQLMTDKQTTYGVQYDFIKDVFKGEVIED